MGTQLLTFLDQRQEINRYRTPRAPCAMADTRWINSRFSIEQPHRINSSYRRFTRLQCPGRLGSFTTIMQYLLLMVPEFRVCPFATPILLRNQNKLTQGGTRPARFASPGASRGIVPGIFGETCPAIAVTVLSLAIRQAQ